MLQEGDEVGCRVVRGRVGCLPTVTLKEDQSLSETLHQQRCHLDVKLRMERDEVLERSEWDDELVALLAVPREEQVDHALDDECRDGADLGDSR